MKDTTANNNAKWRNLAAFWLFGLCNNYAFIVMLSAAEDILERQQGHDHGGGNGTDASSNVCLEEISRRHCTMMSTGAVLLADTIPALIIKATFPFFMHRIPFGIRHLAVVALQASCFIVVAFSSNVAFSLLGVALASMVQGLGEITYLSLTSYFPSSTAAWSAGTGGAAIAGSLAYAFLTEPRLLSLAPSTALLLMLVVPVIFALAYWVLLSLPPTVYRPLLLSPSTWLVPGIVATSPPARSTAAPATPPEAATNSETDVTFEYVDEGAAAAASKKELDFAEKLVILKGLMKYMIPLVFVYFGEYLINQGIAQLILFDCSHGFGLSPKSQYRWYQVLYQIGVFFSRSSVSFIQLSFAAMIALPILQMLNAVFFFVDSLLYFVPHIGIVFTLILIEGLIGGGSYVNTFHRIHKKGIEEAREFSMAVTPVAEAVGILFAGLAAIPLHNFVCMQPLPL